jgi:alkylglycerol monooxygenase
MLLLFISYLFAFIAKIGSPEMFYYGGFVFVMVYAFTELMDRNPYALFWEILKNAFGIAVIYKTGDWFSISNNISAWINYLLIGYFMLSTFVTVWFVMKHSKEDRLMHIIAKS